MCDQSYFHRAQRTVSDLRLWWDGDTVLIPIGFTPGREWCSDARVHVVDLAPLDYSELLAAYATFPITKGDGRHLTKLAQWQKLLVFHPHFAERWQRLLFLDAGMRVLGSLEDLLAVPWEGKVLVWDDHPKLLGGQLDLDANPKAATRLFADFGGQSAVLASRSFLNCMWVLDTSLTSDGKLFTELCTAMNAYPICLCNEMTIMNLVLGVRHGVWDFLPRDRSPSSNKYLFDWSEANRPGTTWRDYALIKYSSTMHFGTSGAVALQPSPSQGSPLFDHVVCLDVEHRASRRAHIETQLQAMGLAYAQRVEATSTVRALSHLAALKKARADGTKGILILEDDVELCVSPARFWAQLHAFHADVGTDFDVCMLHFSRCSRSEAAAAPSSHTKRLSHAQSTAAYIVRDSMYDRLIAAWDAAANTSAPDAAWATLQGDAHVRWYGLTPAPVKLCQD